MSLRSKSSTWLMKELRRLTNNLMSHVRIGKKIILFLMLLSERAINRSNIIDKINNFTKCLLKY